MEKETGWYFYYDYNSDEDKFKIVPSLLVNQLTVSLTGQELYVKQKETSYGSQHDGFIPQMQLTALQDQIFAASDNHGTLRNSYNPSENNYFRDENILTGTKI